MVVSMLQNLSHKYYSHYIIIKFVGFELIYYVINFNVVSSSLIFSDLVSRPEARSDSNVGSEPGSGRETIYWDSLPVFFFSELNLYLWVYKQFQ